MAKQPKPTFAQVRRQISYRPCSRIPAASAAQLDLVARLILDCWNIEGFRWELGTQEALDTRRASGYIESFTTLRDMAYAGRGAR